MLRNAAFLLLSIVLSVSPAFGQEWARKMFKVRSHDFGSVARDAKTEFEFVLSNIYLEDVHISSVRTSCGCTTPSIEKGWLKTYEEGAIVARFNTAAFRGSRSATLTVTFDKPFYAQIQLHVRGNIRSDVVLNPGSINFGSVDQGTAAESRAVVRYSGWGGGRILEARSSNPHVSATVTPRGGRYGQNTYDLTVRLDENAPVGYIKDRLVLVTSDGRSTQIPIAVEGNVLSGITVSPASLFLGVLEPGDTVTKRVVVRGKKPFRILSITCEGGSFDFDTSGDQTAKPVHVIPVTFIAGENTGKVTRTIRIETDLGNSTPELAAYAVVSKH